MSSGPAHDDEPADAMLRAALRHAPDREAVPPPAVSRAILAAARRAAAPRRPGLLAALGAAWTSLWRQPAAGAAFASLMLGTLIVLMWRDGPPPEAEPRLAETAAQPQSASAAPAAASAGPVASEQTKARAEVSAGQTRATSALPTASMADLAATAPADARADASAAPAPVQPQRLPRVHDAARAEPATAAPREDQRHRTSGAAERPSVAAPTPSIATAPAPLASPKPASPATAARTEAAMASPPPPSPLAEAGADAAAPTQVGSVESAAPATPVAPAPQDAARSADSTSADPLAPLLAALRPPGDTGATMSGRQAALAARHASSAKAAAETAEARSAAAAPHATEDAPLPRALREARAAARGRWQLVDASGLAAGTELRSPAGAALGRIAIEADALLWQPAGLEGRRWRVPLAPEVLARLRSALPTEPAPDAPSGSPPAP